MYPSAVSFLSIHSYTSMGIKVRHAVLLTHRISTERHSVIKIGCVKRSTEQPYVRVYCESNTMTDHIGLVQVKRLCYK
ncbi:hypothetical protein GDO81_017328 [Engystomops pustulosus]|uniref:Uncharacterized protein n=1 Tax=Engystomops pustulosus TaxID=76066 RepID=A0AAV7AIY6_ENGPU|nr:hypothetical protein GDO81_017328 [Engystomops pustulosus]